MLGAAATTSGVTFRCDDRFSGKHGTSGIKAGCVYPSYLPTLRSLANLKFIAANIRHWQSKGDPRLLHRNSFLTRANRRVVCRKAKVPRGWTPPPGWPLPASAKPNRPSCDEYPFAATKEGGVVGHYGWVPKRENDSQGGRVNGFFNQNRVLDAFNRSGTGDGFYVAV